MNPNKNFFLKSIILCLTLVFLSSFYYPDARAADKAKQSGIKKYPKEFHGVGPIDRINKTHAVIRDAYYRLSPNVTYHTPDGLYEGLEYLKVGDVVGFFKNKKGEIVSIWLIK